MSVAEACPQPPVTLITGGAQGIGLGITRHLHHHGHRVAIADIDRQALDEVATAVASDRLLGTYCDVADTNQVATWMTTVMQRWGRIDAVVKRQPKSSLLNPVGHGQAPDNYSDLKGLSSYFRRLFGAALRVSGLGPVTP